MPTINRSLAGATSTFTTAGMSPGAPRRRARRGARRGRDHRAGVAAGPGAARRADLDRGGAGRPALPAQSGLRRRRPSGRRSTPTPRRRCRRAEAGWPSSSSTPRSSGADAGPAGARPGDRDGDHELRQLVAAVVVAGRIDAGVLAGRDGCRSSTRRPARSPASRPGIRWSRPAVWSPLGEQLVLDVAGTVRRRAPRARRFGGARPLPDRPA